MTEIMGFDLIGRYGHKVKTLDELCALLGSIYRPHRTRSVVLCHGVFDIVHPGHLRHLLYAKSKAEVLVASITPDIYVDKAKYRPFVPQALRALNLAALEMVDYVLIDTISTPLLTLARLQPDFFAKGYEYQSGGLSAATQLESASVQSYGGEVLFTPGDVNYSSSALLDAGPPDIKYDKLRLLMDAAGISFNELRSMLHQFSTMRVHVVGDTIVDTLTYTTQLGGISKTPTPSVQYEREEHFIGGAGIVALHLAAAGASVSFSTVLNDEDAPGNFVLEEMPGRIKLDVHRDRARPTTQKNAFVCGGYRLLKVDMVDNRPISDEALHQICENVRATAAEAVVFSDFRHGIFNRSTIPLLTSAATGSRLVADSQVASRWGNILDFKGCDLITPNEREARFALGDQDIGVLPLVEKLHQTALCDTAIMKLGAYGLACCHKPTIGTTACFALDSFARCVVDPVGAGDALLAYATLGQLFRQPVAAAILGTVAAALECEVDGNVPVSADDVLKRLGEIEG